jgi:CRISPR-associated protein Cmr6
MPVAAVPRYLGSDHGDASPGLRFGLLLPIWTDRADQEREVRDRVQKRSFEGQEISRILDEQGMDAAIDVLRRRERGKLPGLWEKNDSGARKAWRRVCGLAADDKQRMGALAERQAALAATLETGGGMLVVDGLAVAPFTTGLGNEHPLENGFAFLNPYGLPYLPGSGVKGVLRQAARELARGKWGGTQGWGHGETFPVQLERNRVVDLSIIDALFGLEAADGGSAHVRGALNFWDVIPQIKGDGLQVEVMTAHHTDYFQHGKTPHDSESPNPINFLTVPPGSRFTFHVQCDLPFLRHLAPGLTEGNRWQELVQAAFELAFDWLGFGAKTAVGYGAMAADDAAAARRRTERERAAAEAAQKAQRERELAAMSPLEREIADFLESRADKGQPEITALVSALKNDHWSGEQKSEVAQILKTRMETAGKWKPQSAKKNPAKDKDHQNTLLVQAWIAGD